MSEIDKTHNLLRNNFLSEMDFVANIGRKMFLFPFIGRTKFSMCCYYLIYGLIFFTSMHLFVTLLFGSTDWFEIVNIAPNFGVSLIILLKYGKVHKNKELYEKISQHFRNDLWSVISDCAEHRRILNKYTQTTRNILRFQFYYTIILVVIVTLLPRFIMFYETNVVGKEPLYLFPIDGWYPFDKIEWYNIVYIWESCTVTVVLFLYLFINMLHISFTRCICMELKMLGSTMQSIISKDDFLKIQRKISNNKIHYCIRQKLKFVISKHNFLAQITSELDVVLGDVMLLTYLFGSVLICLTAFTTTVVNDTYKCLRYFSFCCALLVYTFLQCIIGQLLINHSEYFEKAIYSADWVYADSYTKKVLLIFLIRVQKPFSFKAKGYLTMNLDTFGRICSLSYQFFNLLRTAYSK